MGGHWLLVLLLMSLSNDGRLTEASLGNKRLYYKTGTKQYEVRQISNQTIKEPPPHELVAKMARYIVHTSGEY